jgi:predicted dehydrogenase
MASLPVIMAPAIVGCRASRERLRIAAVGAGDKGETDIRCCASEEIVAICDVDETMAVDARKAHPRARFFTDWREMFDREAGTFDAVLISTPDHLHAVIASRAMKMGKHVYCQKPLTLTLDEGIYLRDLAKGSGLATQMGNQGSAEDSFRRSVEILRAGVIGQIREAYVWSDRPIWPQGIRDILPAEPIPPRFNWDHWLGPAPYRPFHRKAYHPFNWRAWFDFGTGALGDMGCHLLNLPFRAAELEYPSTVEPLHETGENAETYPTGSRLRFVFSGSENRPPVELFWSDGVENVADLPEGVRIEVQDLLGTVAASGCLIRGERGIAFSPGDYGERLFLKLKGEREWSRAATHPAAANVERTLPRIRKRDYADLKHHYEWIRACKDGSKTFSDFETGCHLTQLVLLGCAAVRTCAKIQVDPRTGSIQGPKEAVSLMARQYRKGWELA